MKMKLSLLMIFPQMAQEKLKIILAELDGLISIQQKKSTKTTQRSETITQQELINKLAQKVMENYPKITKEMLANTISTMQEVKISEGTIRKDYLSKFPDF